jgi:hypothetical protein
MMSGVEKRRSDVSLPVAIGQIFTWPPQSGLTWFCFLFPLIELDRHISSIQLSEKGSRCCARKADGSCIETNQAKLVVQDLVGVRLGTGSLPFMFGAQPLAKPSASVSFHYSIGWADRAQAEVVGPSDHFPVELCHYLLDGLLSCASSSRFASVRPLSCGTLTGGAARGHAVSVRVWQGSSLRKPDFLLSQPQLQSELPSEVSDNCRQLGWIGFPVQLIAY